MPWADPPRPRPHPRFATQALLVQVAVLLLIIGLGFALVAYLLHAELERQYEQRALAVARAVAADDVVIRAVAAHSPGPQVQRRARRYAAAPECCSWWWPTTRASGTPTRTPRGSGTG
ncbi:hypothetical protein [Microbispora sp. GKU 823]|uniref:hypothetical protein n=1 Tax=Microbispora sp. GKU 823 TaxID=1652100 RepID=UPI001C4E163A|nr:hypothetical protein [Microbispora sp. GKU 823]